MDDMLNREQMIERMNGLCGHGDPFFFVVDYRGERGVVFTMSELENSRVFCNIRGVEINSKYQQVDANQHVNRFKLAPISFAKYKHAFDKVLAEMKKGNTYLLNLTFSTKICADLDLKYIYANSVAPYKLLFNDEFVFYSPEPFIRISDNKIYSFPMKGTIDATLDDAESLLINNDKERYEHNTIVDLIRNDLSMVSSGVNVDTFRYLERIKTSNGAIFQTSSQISGHVVDNWKSIFGDLLFSMLPAGSISGAPKQKTLEIIDECEISERGFYCGVMGFFDGLAVDSCVNIRYIEKDENGDFYYRSGGGITSLSNAEDEYNELIDKIYVPIL